MRNESCRKHTLVLKPLVVTLGDDVLLVVELDGTPTDFAIETANLTCQPQSLLCNPICITPIAFNQFITTRQIQNYRASLYQKTFVTRPTIQVRQRIKD
jgi:hypothetical protein